MQLPKIVAALALSSSFALAACGSDKEKSSEASEEQSTPAQAIKEIDATRTGLDMAVRQVRSGDRKAAEDTAAETYLEHFEKVEGPLEEAISGALRQKIKSTAPAGEVAKFVKGIKADLATAEAKLKQ